jgi:hypothetical protein
LAAAERIVQRITYAGSAIFASELQDHASKCPQLTQNSALQTMNVPPKIIASKMENDEKKSSTKEAEKN